MHAFPLLERVPRGLRTLALLFVPLLLTATVPSAGAQERSPVDPERPWLAEGDSLVSAGKRAEALEVYRALIDEHPEDVELWLRLSSIHLFEGQAAEALEAARRARRLDPEGPEPYLMLAQSLFATGDTPGGMTTLEEGVAAHPDDLPLLWALTEVKLGMGDWGAAAGLLRQLILLDPENPMYYADLGRIQHRVGEMDLAYENLQKALELDAPRAPTLALLGHVCVALGRLDEAREHLQESLSLEESGEAWAGMGGVHFLEGNAPEAEAAFRHAVEIDDSDPDAWFNLGIVLGVQERPEEAEAAFRKAIEADPGPASVSARLNLGVLLLTRQAVQEAQEQFQTAIRLNPRFPDPYLHLARIAGARFDYAEAKRRYEQYRDRLSDQKEIARIEGILGDLDQRIQEREAAVGKGEVHLLQIMTASRESAERALQRVQSGEDFYVVGEETSRLASITGVDIGFVDPRSLNEGFREAILALEVGQYTGALQGSQGWFVFMRVE